MSLQSSITSTVTAGIQDISALLPLLGTDQCEEHTGSALGKGFFYTSVTSISIFGSLGIVKAGFNVFVAAIIVPSWKFLGAQRLADGGFRPKGEVAQLIALDPQNPGCFLAESNLEKILEEEHIENIEDLRVSWAPGSLRWNIKMVICTLLTSTLGITPYLYIILHRSSADDNPLFLSGWGFPIIRLVGSALAGIVIQIIIQIRLLIIIKHRLVFLTVDRYIKAHLDERHSKHLRQCLPLWERTGPSEMCLWELDTFLKDTRNKTPPNTTSNTKTPLPNNQYNFSELENHFQEVKRYHLPKLSWNVDLAGLLKSWLYTFLHVVLLVALVLSVGGYVGCFNLIQSAGHDGPILWLVFEILLCLLRILVWAWNPELDDNKGVTFSIALAPQSPLVTCNIFGNEFKEAIDQVPVTRSQSFLQEIALYTGFLPAFQWNDASLYYILTGSEYNSDGPAKIPKVLYIVVSAFKEQTSRLVLKKEKQQNFLFFISKLNPDPNRTAITINTPMGDSTQPETHVLTSDPNFVEKLSAHYDKIVRRISYAHEKSQQFHSSWALRRIETSNDATNSPDQPIPQCHLTKADFEYLKHGRLETRRNNYARRLETWVNKFLEVFEKELFDTIPFALHSHGPMSKHQGIETNEVEYLIAEARRHVELLLLDVFKSWRHLVAENHAEMKKDVTSFFEMSSQLSSTKDATDPHLEMNASPHLKRNSVAKISHRLQTEQEFSLQYSSNLDFQRMCDRIDEYAKVAQERIGKRRYLDPKEGNNVIDLWGSRLGLDRKTYIESEPGHASNPISNFQPAASPMVEKYDKAMRGRLQNKKRFLGGAEGAELENRCYSRVGQWKTKLLVVVKELQMVTAPKFLLNASFIPLSDSDTTRKYWSRAAIRQRLSIMDHVKYVIVSDELVNDLGGFENLAFALKHSRASVLYFRCAFRLQAYGDSPIQKMEENGMLQDLSPRHPDHEFLPTDSDSPDDNDAPEYGYNSNTIDDVLDSEEPQPKRSHILEHKTMVDIAQSTPSITGIHFYDKSYRVFPTVQDAIIKNIDSILEKSGLHLICEYENIKISDYFRRNRPYVLFDDPKHSKCNVKFYVDKKVDHTLILTHAFTASDAEIDIKVNGQRFTRIKCSRSRAVNEFYEDRITIPGSRLNARRALNFLVIKLSNRFEPANYFLGDIILDKKMSERV